MNGISGWKHFTRPLGWRYRTDCPSAARPAGVVPCLQSVQLATVERFAGGRVPELLETSSLSSFDPRRRDAAERPELLETMKPSQDEFAELRETLKSDADELPALLEAMRREFGELALDDVAATLTCGCGSGSAVSGRRRYSSSACRQRAYRRRLRGR